MPSRLATRLRRLEAQHQESPPVQGLSAVLAYARRHQITSDSVPLANLSDVELEAKLAALAGQRGFAICLRAFYEAEWTRRQAAQSQEPSA